MKNYLKKAIIVLLILFCAKTLYASALEQIIEQMSAQKTESAAKRFFGYDKTTLWMLVACGFIAWNLPKLAEEIAKEFEGAPLGGSVGKGAWGASTKLAMGAATVGAGLASKAIDKFGKKGKGGGSSSPSSSPSAGSRTFPGATGSTGADTASGGSDASTGADTNTGGGGKGGAAAPALAGIPLNNATAANNASGQGGNATGASSGSNKAYPTAEDDINEIYGGDAGFMKDIIQQSKKGEANKANAANGTKTETDATKSAGANSAKPKELAANAKGQDGKDGKSKLLGGIKQTAGVVGKTAKTVGKVALTATLLTSVAGVGILAAKALSPKDDKKSSGPLSLFGLGKKAPAGNAPDPNSAAAKQNQKPETPGSDRKDDKPGQKQPEMPGRDRAHEEIAKLDNKINQLRAEVNYKVNDTAARLHSETITVSNQAKNTTEARIMSVKADLDREVGRTISVANEALNKTKKGG